MSADSRPCGGELFVMTDDIYTRGCYCDNCGEWDVGGDGKCPGFDGWGLFGPVAVDVARERREDIEELNGHIGVLWELVTP